MVTVSAVMVPELQHDQKNKIGLGFTYKSNHHLAEHSKNEVWYAVPLHQIATCNWTNGYICQNST